MARGNTVVGLDIGTHAVKALVAQKRGSVWQVLSSVQVPSFGLRRGAVASIDETVKCIQKAVGEAEKESGQKLSSAFVNISGSHLYVIPSDGIISVSRADQRISREDIERVLQATQAINIPRNEAVLDVFEREYIIDDQRGIRHPEGLTGVRLEAKVLLLCYFQQYFTSLTQAVLGSRIQIRDIVPSPLAAANAVLTPQQKELGVAVIDLGAETTSLAVFEEGDMIHCAVFPIGSANITKDIAIGLKTEVQIAESIKKQHGTCTLAKPEISAKRSSSPKKIEISSGFSEVDFTKKDLVSIIKPRVTEILDVVQKELKKIGRQELLPGGVILTGGGAKLPKIKELARDTLKLNCQIGTPRGFEGLENDPALATVVGLALEGVDGEDGGDIGNAFSGVAAWFKKVLRLFVP